MKTPEEFLKDHDFIVDEPRVRLVANLIWTYTIEISRERDRLKHLAGKALIELKQFENTFGNSADWLEDVNIIENLENELSGVRSCDPEIIKKLVEALEMAKDQLIFIDKNYFPTSGIHSSQVTVKYIDVVLKEAKGDTTI